MKKPSLVILLVFIFFNSYSQAKVCKLPTENDIEDINVISVKKCDIDDIKSSEKIIKTNTLRKRIKNAKSKPNIKNLSREVLFTLVQEIPMFESCNKTTRKNDVICFKRKIKKHFSKNFYADEFNNEFIDEKIYIKFSIDLYGNVINTQLKSKKHSKKLHDEINRVLQKLPTFIPGKQKGLPVIVIYSFPFNLTLN